ncbi:adenosylcobinamide kinase/adenosylcobinamide phosphate guanyltransferase [Thalassobacillus devorans]|uniref:Adenosylcobinamide kinase n=1 Tax=Thalassobacillus devorans TaxID=279813 RepID=A0ABQ1NFH8_9BACI|nr:bifunctional adenosylcobinamide kinase/adenosylcobinamide-phosphate guanylyltransferase [Thalassobacillus devorans]NIK27173.1 adenosylcobinamide kinase/adenosylcobinamide-phosphate guanylyltransferase [Thalassobacillus devorans]GGC75563.1 adenosylcobinamide kinase/adenosylcobinamide phosphate guanyltransferase [Thalassobacillus devorans]
MLTFISGGARSGKSSFAEKLALESYHKHKDGNLYYFATSVPSDEEMEARIARHRGDRGEEWQTIEASLHVKDRLCDLPTESTVLIDCLTVWLSNRLYIGQAGWETIMQEVSGWIQTAQARQLNLYIVSNDVNEGIPSSVDSVASYTCMLEKLHQYIISSAEKVYQVIAGLPVKWKDD